MDEEWRDIAGYEGKYQVSNLGHVRSVAKDSKYRVGVQIAEITRSPKPNVYGYVYVTLRNGRSRKVKSVHRLVLETFAYKPVGGIQCNHINGIKTDNRLENLEWVTPKENNDHKINVLGKHHRGEQCYNAKLTWEKVENIRSVYERGDVHQSELARKYRVCNQTVCKVISKKTWKVR